ncbi:MAG: hypothetical protein DME26_00715 [Verrucomicrobia bacterium]|nr:MAG: hypothetical protein DME26_00715 [Verrucomicrobiota bacterium]
MHWTHLPVALVEENGVMIFSGSAVVDWNNTSGFGTATQPAVVAIYTGHQVSPELEAQNLAFSTDRGRTWKKFSGNSVLNIDSRSFRDPKVFWHAPTKKWVMVVSHADDKTLGLYGSRDLKKWESLSTFGPAGAHNKRNWECPDLFELPVEGKPEQKKWVLQVALGGGAVNGGSGGEYFVGTFDGKEFHIDNPPDVVLWADYGKDDYAAVSWSDIPASDGRRLWLGWMNNWQYADKIPTHPWRGAMTVPRVLTLKQTDQGLRLAQRPAAELQRLRGEHKQYSDVRVKPDAPFVPGLSGASLEIIAEFEPGSATEFGLKVRKSASEQTVVGYDGQLFVDRIESGMTDFSPEFPGTSKFTSSWIARRWRCSGTTAMS